MMPSSLSTNCECVRGGRREGGRERREREREEEREG